jgi:hypothetical protein
VDIAMLSSLEEQSFVIGDVMKALTKYTLQLGRQMKPSLLTVEKMKTTKTTRTSTTPTIITGMSKLARSQNTF